jgi:Zn-dependent peptidase ImmA (M78 family)
MFIPYNSYQIEKIAQDFIKDNFIDYYKSFEPLDLTDIFDNKLENLTGFQEEVISDSLMKRLAGSDKEALMLPDEKLIILSESVYLGLIKNNPRDRFTLCHEIGHALLHSKSNEDNIIYFKAKNINYEDIENIAEYQAHHFAAALLMPFHHVKNILQLNGNYKHIYKFFNSSQEATRRRIDFVKSKMYEYIF